MTVGCSTVRHGLLQLSDKVSKDGLCLDFDPVTNCVHSLQQFPLEYFFFYFHIVTQFKKIIFRKIFAPKLRL